MNQAIRKLSGLLVLPVLLAALLLMPVKAYAEDAATGDTEPVAYECDVKLPVTVELNGDYDGTFRAVLSLDPEKGQNSPMPEEYTLTLTKDTTGYFTIHYTEPGDYFYVVRQTLGDTQYMTYDETVYYVQIQVVNSENGGLEGSVHANKAENPTEKSSELRFLNTYAPPAPGPAATATPTPTPDPATPTVTPAPTTGFTLPQTGDTMPLVTVLVVMLVAAAALVILFVVRKRKNSGK